MPLDPLCPRAVWFLLRLPRLPLQHARRPALAARRRHWRGLGPRVAPCAAVCRAAGGLCTVARSEVCMMVILGSDESTDHMAMIGTCYSFSPTNVTARFFFFNSYHSRHMVDSSDNNFSARSRRSTHSRTRRCYADARRSYTASLMKFRFDNTVLLAHTLSLMYHV